MCNTLKITPVLIVLIILVIACSLPLSYAADSIPDIQSVSEFEPGLVCSISSAQGLFLLADLVNSGMDMKGITFVLADDIVLHEGSFSEVGVWSGAGEPAPWTPIGDSFNKFSGRFDGAGHSISGMYCSSDSGFVGLFGRIIDGSVENLTIKNSYARGISYVGGIAGYALSLDDSGGIKNCNVDIIIDSAARSAGAVVGCAVSGGDIFTVEGCSSTSNLPAIGMTIGEVIIRGNSVIIRPEITENRNFPWLWISLILAGCVALISVLVIKNIRERKSAALKAGVAGVSDFGASVPGAAALLTGSPEARAPESDTADSGKEAATAAPGVLAAAMATQTEPSGTAEKTPVEPVEADAPPAEKQTAPETGAKTVISARDTSKPRPLGYYYIKQTPEGFMFSLKAANHETLALSPAYQSLAACKKAISSLARNVSAAVIDDLTELAEDKVKVYAPKFEIYLDNAGEYRFRIKAANYETIATSPAYATKSGCRSAIDSVIHNVETKKLIVEDEETAKRREKLRAEIVRAERISVENANSLIDDLTAGVLLETLDSDEGYIKRHNCVDVWLDTIGEHFNSGDIVNTAALIRKGLVPPNTKHIRVLGRGTLDKALTVEANQFSLDAVKIIVLTGGNPVRTND
ncbi:MAG: uL15 family ribosomal protein [Eubacteriales bacterium]